MRAALANDRRTSTGRPATDVIVVASIAISTQPTQLDSDLNSHRVRASGIVAGNEDMRVGKSGNSDAIYVAKPVSG